jgi:hypothetical protein
MPSWQAVVLVVAIEGIVGCFVEVARRSSHASVPPPIVNVYRQGTRLAVMLQRRFCMEQSIFRSVADCHDIHFLCLL